MLFLHWVRRAASRACWTAGRNRAVRTAMIAFTTGSLINVTPPSGAGSVDVHGIVWAKSANAISCIQSSGRCTSETTGTIAERDLTCGTTNATGPQLAATAADCWSVLNTRYRQQRLRIEDVPSVHQLELKDCQQRRRGLRRVVREHFGESGTHSQSSLAMASTPGFGTTLSQATTVGGGSAARNRT